MKKIKKMYDLADIIPLLSPEALKVAGGMIEDAQFMRNQMDQLKVIIDRDGVSEQFQYGSKQTAAMTSFLQLQKQYGTIIRYLTDLLPKEDKASAPADLLDWVNNN